MPCRSPSVSSEPHEISNMAAASGTRREDLLMDKETLQRIWILRKHLADMNSIEAMEFVKDRVEASRNNDDFLSSMNG